MKKRVISTSSAPAAIGPYSQGIDTGDMVFISGQLPINPETSEFDGDDIKLQTARSLDNVKAVLGESGLTMENVIKTTVFLTSMDEFADMNSVYSSYFAEPFPARSAFQVAALPRGAKVEIEVIAVK